MSGAAASPAPGNRRFPGVAGLGPLHGRRVLVRADLNVPLRDGAVSDASRLEALVPTLNHLRERGARIAILSHFGRPKGHDPALSLRPVAPALGACWGAEIGFAEDCIGPAADQAIRALPPGGAVVLENTRFHPGEEANDPAFADALARLGDAYVNDAFSAAHRAHASTEGLARRLPAVAGLALQAELDALEAALGSPVRPVAAVVGGAKVSSKLDILGNLIGRVDTLVIGGGMANTFLFAEGRAIGKSLAERDLAETARAILGRAKAAGTEILLPIDVVVAEKFEAHAPSAIVAADAVPPGAMILDLGPQSVARIAGALGRARTVVWNGPLGAFELAPFDAATKAAAGEVARLTRAGQLLSVAGGGDTLAALNRAMAARDFSFVSTAGGAFLEWLEGKALPGIDVLLSPRF
ncbi:phosphoglycerate kinase [Zavarzinia compransoris]|uniref:Phosphoglycerate kinase n=1 Tax=Zavarzinia compransoris TaxID=1264899 RepID=A0A317E8S0_9PROT|nr:phosphoglycerate kinase [Zavarzinia compransoris]PWR23131.1 phosphoglycerate kinase [Zavarzinia compransoris]TDP46314.1 phosphoglycerate kinase [Zavarzinia compransoris]